MTMDTTAHPFTRPTATRTSLDDLAAKSVRELALLYATGTVPRLRDLDGTPRGRMLTWVGPLGKGAAWRALRRFARSRTFPWGGKSFASRTDAEGRGVNRVLLVGDQFEFATRIGPSVVDGKPCVILDYDQPTNPWFIRKIHDELRQVGPRTYLGPAMWKGTSGETLVLYFAIGT
jgi:hypothetical protein